MSPNSLAIPEASPGQMRRLQEIADIEIVIPRLSDNQMLMAKNLSERVITTEQAHVEANDGLNAIAAAVKGLESLRKEMTAPLLGKKGEIDAQFKAQMTLLSEWEAALKQKILAWRRAETDRIEAERRKIEAENLERERLAREALAEKARQEAEEAREMAKMLGEDEEAAAKEAEQSVMAPTFFHPVTEAAEVPPPAPTTVRTDFGSSTVRKVWTFEILDAKLVPEEFKVVDEKRIRAAIQSFNVREIPGVRIYQEESLSSRR